MSIKPVGDLGRQVGDELKRQADNLHRVIVRRLNIAGEQAVNKARINETSGGYSGPSKPYTVQSGNLISSVGYIIVANGQVINTKFDVVQGGTEGASTGLQYAKKLVAQYPTGYALILVAGMHYASYVQELHGYDVLVSPTLVAEKLVKQLQEKLRKWKGQDIK